MLTVGTFIQLPTVINVDLPEANRLPHSIESKKEWRSQAYADSKNAPAGQMLD